MRWARDSAPAGRLWIALRSAALADHFRLADVPVHAQWSSFALFAIVFAVGLALIAYIVKLAFPGGPKATEK